MSFSSYVAQQRENEQKALRTFLVFSLMGSVVLHLVGFALVVTLSSAWVRKSKLVQESIPVILLEPPSPSIPPLESEQPSKPRSVSTLPPKQVATPKFLTTPITTLPPKRVETPSLLPTPVATSPSQLAQTLTAKRVSIPTPSLATTQKPTSTSHLSIPTSSSVRQENIPDGKSQSTSVATASGNRADTGTGGLGQSNGTGNNLTAGSGNGSKVGTGLGNGNGEGDSATSLGSDGVVCLRCPAPDPPSGSENLEGRAIVEIDIDTNGSVRDIQIVTSTGHDNLDRSALETIKKKWKFVSSGTRQRVRAAVNFTIAGSNFDNLARKRERQAHEDQQRRRERVLKP